MGYLKCNPLNIKSRKPARPLCITCCIIWEAVPRCLLPWHLLEKLSNISRKQQWWVKARTAALGSGTQWLCLSRLLAEVDLAVIVFLLHHKCILKLIILNLLHCDFHPNLPLN